MITQEIKRQLANKDLLQSQIDLWRTVKPLIDEEFEKTTEDLMFVKGATLVAWIMACIKFESGTERKAFLIVANELSKNIK